MKIIFFTIGLFVLLTLFASLPFLMLIRVARKDYTGFGKRFVLWVIACILLGVWGLPGYKNLANKVYFDKCCNNLLIVARALDLYAAKNDGIYPESLDHVYVGAKKDLPRCPVDKRSYSEGYEVNDDRTVFTITCRSGHRLPKGSLPGNYPQYSSKYGLITGLPGEER
ncbi:MAG: hypothetical protein J7M18_02080 [Candidatus Eremiobacteraeota bacterium]|nr:hypothetical protein [Candidatus Eremiobacteraeota bacterium]